MSGKWWSDVLDATVYLLWYIARSTRIFYIYYVRIGTSCRKTKTHMLLTSEILTEKLLWLTCWSTQTAQKFQLLSSVCNMLNSHLVQIIKITTQTTDSPHWYEKLSMCFIEHHAIRHMEEWRRSCMSSEP